MEQKKIGDMSHLFYSVLHSVEHPQCFHFPLEHHECQGRVSAVTVFKHTVCSSFHTSTTGLSTVLNHWDELLLMDKEIKLALTLQSILQAWELMHNAAEG